MPTKTDPIINLRAAIADAAAAVGATPPSEPKLERPPRPDFGDYSSNIAMLVSASLGERPRDAAERIGEELRSRLGEDLERAEVAGPGFLNLFMSDAWYRRALADMVGAGADWGAGTAATPEHTLIEFVSANPTGPVTAASGRHAAYGDSLARICEFAGHRVEREYYVNDLGSQVLRFGESIKARARGEEPPEDGYKGDYVRELAQRIDGAADADPQDLARAGVALMIEQIEATLQRFGVRMDRFFSERTLYDEGRVDEMLGELASRGHVYESEGATWMRTTTFGDDKDRVIRRSTGDVTYFASDIAYHADKHQRDYDRVIDIWGADHHGYIARLKVAWQALGGEPDRFEILIMQLVNLTERGEQKRMSKRQGDFVTLDDLIDDIGVDAARFFMVMRSHDTALDLDLTLAREQSQENPVYYVQYAHARIASILRRAEGEPDATAEPTEELHPSAKGLIKFLLEFPAEITTAADMRAPHRLTTYARELASGFSAFYRDCKVVGTPEEAFRLALSVQTQQVIARALDLLGVSAPEEM